MNSLPLEIFCNIIGFLKNKPGYLFSCLLTNRFWCLNAVPILWSDPFALCNASSNRKKQSDLVDTIISFFSRPEQQQLQTDPNLIRTHSPLFPYLSYIRHLDDSLIFSRIMLFWYYFHSKPTKTLLVSFSLFFRLLIDKTDGIISLQFTPNIHKR